MNMQGQKNCFLANEELETIITFFYNDFNLAHPKNPKNRINSFEKEGMPVDMRVEIESIIDKNRR